MVVVGEDRAKRLGRYIVNLRNERGLSQKELAHKARVGRSWLSRVEHGGICGPKGPSPTMLMRVARSLGVDPYQFWRELGYREEDLAQEDRNELSEDTVEFALWLEQLPPGTRGIVIQGF